MKIDRFLALNIPIGSKCKIEYVNEYGRILTKNVKYLAIRYAEGYLITFAKEKDKDITIYLKNLNSISVKTD